MSNFAWSAGLFCGEGCCTALYRNDIPYMSMQIRMLDERAIKRFAKDVGLPYYIYNYEPDRPAYGVSVGGRRATDLARKLWPHLKGTDKGDQIKRRAIECEVFNYVSGRTDDHPARRKPRMPAQLSEAHRAAISAGQTRAWKTRRAQ